MSRLYDAIQKSQGQLGEIGRNLVNNRTTPESPAPEPVQEEDTPSRFDANGTEANGNQVTSVTDFDEVTKPAAVQPALVKTPGSGTALEAAEPPVLKRRRRRPVLTMLALCVVAGIGYSAWRIYGGHNILPAWTGQWTGQGTSPSDLRFTGVVVAQETAVSAKIPGRIERLLVDEGSQVKAGDVIAILDRQETAAESDNQKAKVDQLNARLSQSEEQLRLETERNQHQLDRALAQRKVMESELRTAEVELEQSRTDLNRGRDLQQAGVIPTRDMERYQMAVAVNEARVKSAAQRVQAGQAELDLMRSNLRQVAVAASDVEQTRAQLVQAQASQQQTAVRLGYSTIRAPMSGLVSVRVARQGEVVGTGSTIVTIVDLKDIWVKADVEETWISRIRIDTRLPVQLASGDRTTGQVFFISPEAEFATQRDISRVKRDIRTFGIKVRLANDSGRIHPGMTAYVMLPNLPAAGVQ